MAQLEHSDKLDEFSNSHPAPSPPLPLFRYWYWVHYLHLHIHETLSYVVPLLVITRHYKKFKMSAFHRFSSSPENIAGLALQGYIHYFWIYATSVNI
ncbi:hypothetical protein FF1_036995 [Malus domestica]